ncbi:MAG: DUF4147 domain-containing protein [Candidatus Thermoplasmatota archaeon]|nr:DUF4147 domain-containing protein [Candidatus Thermoplasmatota archaeon]
MMLTSLPERRKMIMDTVMRSIDELSPKSIMEGKTQDVSRFIAASRYSIFAVGKASVEMCKGLKRQIIGGAAKAICLSPLGYEDPEGFASFHGNHPYPGKESFSSSKVILNELLADNSQNLLFLLSGGASSLFEVPVEDITDQQYLELMKKLITADYPIDVINEVRCQLSRVKCGKMLRLTRYEKVKIMAISDVPGDDISIIGSNPFYPTARDVKIPDEIEKVVEVIRHSEDGDVRNMETLPDYSIILSGHIYSSKMLEEISTDSPKVNFGEVISGNVKDLAPYLMRLIRTRYSELKRPFWFTGHGESTANVTGDGRGGRNTYLSSLMLKEAEKDEVFSFLSFATDGSDGNSGLAGFLVDEQIRDILDASTINEFIRNSNTGELAVKCGTGVRTGPTGNNVSDVILGYYGGRTDEDSLQ